MRALYIVTLLACLAAVAGHASLSLRNDRAVVSASEAWTLEPGLVAKLQSIYDGISGPDTPAGKAVPDGPAFQLNLIVYQTANIIVSRIHRDATAKPASLWVAGTVEGEKDSHVQLVFIGDAVVGSIRLESGAAYILSAGRAGGYVVRQLEPAWQAGPQAGSASGEDG